MWTVYLLLCHKDNSFYCGSTTNLDKRLREHETGRGARYTRGRLPVSLLWASKDISTRPAAQRLEATIKKLTRRQKERLILGAREV